MCIWIHHIVKLESLIKPVVSIIIKKHMYTFKDLLIFQIKILFDRIEKMITYTDIWAATDRIRSRV